MDAKLLSFRSIGDHRGQLVPLEEGHQVPFAIKRVYYIYANRDEVRRGFHAHKDLLQLAVCVAGSCKFEIDDGTRKQIFELNEPTQGLYLGNLLWREMFDFSPDCVLLVLASRSYDEADYIRDYEAFKNIVHKQAQQGEK